jgi:hypothetical protein
MESEARATEGSRKGAKLAKKKARSTKVSNVLCELGVNSFLPLRYP